MDNVEQNKLKAFIESVPILCEGGTTETSMGKDSEYGGTASNTIISLILAETTRARKSELDELNYQIAKNDWFGDNQSEIFVYIAQRQLELEDHGNNV